MSGRRRPPEPAIPVGARGDHQLAPPELVDPHGGKVMPPAPPKEQILASTDPDEAPVPPPGAGEDGPFYRDEAAAEGEEPLGEDLSPEEEVMFASLLTCGRRSKTVKVLDHTVVVETLNNDDDLRIGLFVKDYVGSIGEQRAYQVGVAAAGIRTFDGRPLATTVYTDVDQSALFDEKAAIVLKMYPLVTQRIYRAVLEAEKEFAELVERLGKSNG